MAEEGKEVTEEQDKKVGEAVQFIDPLEESSAQKPEAPAPTASDEKKEDPSEGYEKPEVSAKPEKKSSTEITKRAKDFLQSIKKKPVSIPFILLAVIIAFGTWIRTLNLGSLKGKYLIASDPYLFLRYSQEVFETGKIFVYDYMRYFPIGFRTALESRVLPFFLAYLHKFFSLFNSEITIVQTAIAYPVIFFALSLVVFFFLIRKLFNWKVALLATAFLSVIPVILYRTLAGFSDKEPLGLFFLFVALYFMVSMWQEKNYKRAIIYSILAGLSTSFLGLTWGAVTFILMIFSLFVLIFFFFGKDSRKDFLLYAIWYFIMFLILGVFSRRFGIDVFEFFYKDQGILLSTFVFVLLFAHAFFKHKFKKFEKLPSTVTSFLVITIIFLLGATFMLGPSFVIDKISSVPSKLLQPLGGARVTITVLENEQPYATFWFQNFTLWFFWIFFFGSIYLFYKIVRKLKDSYKIGLTLAYVVFLTGLIFSRYSDTSTFNGTTFISHLLYFGGMLLFLFLLVFIYFKLYYKNKEAFENLLTLDKSLIFVLIWFIWMVIGARGAIRIFFLFAPIACVVASFLFIALWEYGLKIKDKFFKFVVIVVIVGLTILLLGVFTKGSINEASTFSLHFDQQWQGAAQWINENTQEDAVFASWWDYGYFIQTMGERATIVDGGNAIPYWNYLMGRKVFTSNNKEDALEFLYTHNTTHFLIDSSDLLKYSAFSTIGSDKDFDRQSSINAFNFQEASEESDGIKMYFYSGFSPLDEDLMLGNNLYPAEKTSIVAFLVPVSQLNEQEINILQPTAILNYQRRQVKVSVKCINLFGSIAEFEEEGLDGCIYFIPQIISSGENQISKMKIGSLVYLSPKVKESLFTRLYLLDEEIEGFNLVHKEKHHILKELEEGTEMGAMDMANIHGNFAGPIKIWEISYPSDIKKNETFLSIQHPQSVVI